MFSERLRIAVSKQSKDDTEWRKQRDKWKKDLSSSNHTASTKLVGLTIADRTINRKPQNQKFGLGWASIETLAEWTNLSPRTISTTLAELGRDDWIVVQRGTGPGNSNKYTLCLERRLAATNEIAAPAPSNYPSSSSNFLQNLQVLAIDPATSGQTPAILDPNSCKLQQTIKQDLLPTPINNPIRLLAEKVSAQDHFYLAQFLGEGNVELGYNVMGKATPELVDKMAISHREKNAGPDEIKAAFKSNGGVPGS